MTDNITTNGVHNDDNRSGQPIFIIVMGVSGCGKSTLAGNLAKALQIPFLDADSLHPKSNIAKMSAGHPLTDEDRAPWLELVRTTAEHICAEQEVDPNSKGIKGVVIACSALKKAYRDVLRGVHKPGAVPSHLEPPHPHVLPTYICFLKGERETLLDRMNTRQGHFMKSEMLDSQLKTLESPEGEDGVIVVRIEDDPDIQLETAMKGLEVCGALISSS